MDDWGERCYALAPWEETLGCKVWLGGDWCCRERYRVLASAFWELTFYGFEYDLVRARTACEKAARLTGCLLYTSFAEPGDLDRLRMPHEGLGEPVELINPLNADQSVMRQSIVPGLLRSVAYNQSRGVKNVQLYEAGAVFFAAEGRKQPKERRRLAGVLAGAMGEAGWNAAPAPFDFFDGKGVVESLARELALPKLRFKALSADEAPHLQPGRAAVVLAGGAALGLPLIPI